MIFTYVHIVIGYSNVRDCRPQKIVVCSNSTMQQGYSATIWQYFVLNSVLWNNSDLFKFVHYLTTLGYGLSFYFLYCWYFEYFLDNESRIKNYVDFSKYVTWFHIIFSYIFTFYQELLWERTWNSLHVSRRKTSLITLTRKGKYYSMVRLSSEIIQLYVPYLFFLYYFFPF